MDLNGISAFVVVSGSEVGGVELTAANTLGQFTKINGGNIEFYVTATGAEVNTNSDEYVIYFNKAKISKEKEKISFSGDLSINPNVYISKYKKLSHRKEYLNSIEDKFYNIAQKHYV